MFPKSTKRSGSMSSIKSGNRVSSSSYGLEHGIAKVDGIFGKALALATCGSGCTSKMLSNLEDKILSRVTLHSQRRHARMILLKLYRATFYSLYEDIYRNIEEGQGMIN
jgi:hypothetical protein